MRFNLDRGGALVSLGASVVASGLAQTGPVQAAVPRLESASAKHLRELSQVLVGTPRRRDFKAVPMILNNPDFWDGPALATLLAYKGGPKQAWDNTDLAGPWLKGMRNSMNAQVWSFKEPNFLCVSATHGSAHLALFDQDMWDEYQLAKFAGGNITRNTFIATPRASSDDLADLDSADSPLLKDNSIPVLQRRGAVFMACHNAIWQLAEQLVGAERNPDHLQVDAIAAELTNHLIPDVVLTPGVLATLVKFQEAGFAYSR